MSYTRRKFLESASAAGFIAPLSIGASRALPIETAHTGSSIWTHRIQSAEDPLGVRRDFPVVEQGIYLNSSTYVLLHIS